MYIVCGTSPFSNIFDQTKSLSIHLLKYFFWFIKHIFFKEHYIKFIQIWNNIFNIIPHIGIWQITNQCIIVIYIIILLHIYVSSINIFKILLFLLISPKAQPVPKHNLWIWKSFLYAYIIYRRSIWFMLKWKCVSFRPIVYSYISSQILIQLKPCSHIVEWFCINFGIFNSYSIIKL